MDLLTEQQLMGIYSLQHSSQQAEEALSQGLEQLQQSLIDTLAASPVIDGMQQMAVALGKISNLEGFIRQVPFSHLSFFLFFLCFHPCILLYTQTKKKKKPCGL